MKFSIEQNVNEKGNILISSSCVYVQIGIFHFVKRKVNEAAFKAASLFWLQNLCRYNL